MDANETFTTNEGSFKRLYVGFGEKKEFQTKGGEREPLPGKDRRHRKCMSSQEGTQRRGFSGCTLKEALGGKSSWRELKNITVPGRAT